jgi:hypothetical protein
LITHAQLADDFRATGQQRDDAGLVQNALVR